MTERFWQRAIVFLFHLLVLTVPFYFTWVNEELFEFNKMMLTYGISVMILGCWASRAVWQGRFFWQRTPLDLPIALFVASQVLATVFSIHPATSFFGYYTRFHGGLLSTFSYVALYYALVSNVKKEDVPNLLLSTFVAAFGVSLYAIPEHFGVSPSCVMISGEWSVSCWVQDVQSRVFATFGQPNWLAAYAVTLIPLGTMLTLFQKTWRRYFFGVATIALTVTLLYTKSRSGLLGLGVGMFLLTGGYLWLKRTAPNRVSLIKFLMWGVLLVTSSLVADPSWLKSLTQYLPARSTPEVTTPISQPATQQPVNRLELGGTESGEIRKIVWQGSLDVWRRYPLFGSGVETFAYSYYQDRPASHNLVSEWDFLYNKAHNEFLNFLATSGIVGLSMYVLLLGFSTWLMTKTTLYYRSGATEALGMLSGLVALSISNFFGFSTVMVSILFWLYLAWYVLISDQVAAKEKKFSQPVTASLEKEPKAAVQLGIIWLVAGLLIWNLLTFWRADRAFATGKQYESVGRLTEAANYVSQATLLAPREALYYDQLSGIYASLAVQLAQAGDEQQTSQVALAALASSDKALELNPRHLNFYKTRTRVFITLAQLQPSFLAEAEKVLKQALQLSPTEAKLYYNLGIVQISQNHIDQGINSLQKAIELKPNYEAARFHLGQQHQAQGEYQAALEQYHYILEHINPEHDLLPDLIQETQASISAQTPQETP